MKQRTLKALLVLALAFTAFTAVFTAAPQAAYAADSEIFYAKDSSKLEHFKARVFNGLIDNLSVIDVNDIGITGSEITFQNVNGGTLTGTYALAGIVRSHVIFSTYCVSWSGFSFEYSGATITKVNVTYDEYNWTTAITEAFRSSYAEFINGLPADASDFKKVAYIHDWICNHVSYSTGDIYKPSSAIGAIANGKAVCAGYSYAFQFLCQQLGLECNYIYDYPTTVQHAWNKVKIDDQWFYVDVTWDDSAIVGSAATYKYFLLNDSEFEAANNNAHGDSSAWQNASPINTTYYFANKYWQDKQAPLASSAWNEDPQLTDGSTEHVHSWGDWQTTLEATCTTDGSKTRICSTCGETQSEIIPALGHDYALTATKDATCTEDGQRTYICSRCGSSYTEPIPALGHSYTSQVTKPATCAETGMRTYSCARCGFSYEEPIPALGHSYTSQVTKPATCAEAGQRIYTCSRCGATYNEVIPKTDNHSWGSGTITKQPTKGSGGVRTYTCSVCGATKTESIAKLTQVNWTRLWGDTRYDTMRAISKAGWTASQTVIIASAANFPDALSASSLAGVYNCPILLTNPQELSAQATSEIKRLGAKTVYIIGGYSAITSSVDSQVKALGCTVKRVYGSTRQETAQAVANQVGAAHGDTCIVATGKSYPDALSIAPYSFAHKAPIYLTESNGTLSTSTLNAIQAGGYSKVVLVGGASVVAASVQNQLSARGITSIERLGGETRYETSALIANWSVGQGMSSSYVAVSTGDNFADALAGGAFCGKNNSVLVLASDKNRSNISGFVTANSGNIVQGYVLGGENAVSQATWNTLPR